MGKIAEAFERQRREYESERVFIVRPIIINGELRETHTTDRSILNILSFKGTGEKKKFSDIQKEYIQYCDQWNESLWETGVKPTKENPWLDAWVIQHDYQIVFEDGDITFNISSKMGIAS